MELMLRAGKYRIPVEITQEKNRLYFKFGYNKAMLKEIKSMQGAKWHGYDKPNPRKLWSISDSPRNRFQLEYLSGKDPYKNYDKSLVDFTPTRKLYKHQIVMVKHILTYKRVILACEMGTGKTLAVIEAVEQLGIPQEDFWYVGPKSGVKAVSLEFSKWDARTTPGRMLTYEGLTKLLKFWDDDFPAPKFVFFDESSKIKTPSAQRSQAALHLANAMDGYIVLGTGTPAPKSPVDWWHQCEVTCPGFIKEGSLASFKARLCIVEMRESIGRGSYPHLVTWLDDENKCTICGKTEEEDMHIGHDYTKSINEVANLYKRMSGLVLVQFKKDCLDLPEKQYKVIQISPDIETLRAAKLIVKMSRNTVTALTLLRELSDGFQYALVEDGTKMCPLCYGLGIVNIPNENTKCPNCKGSCSVKNYKKIAKELGSKKLEVFEQLLDEHEEVGRFIAWGGFKATIDVLIKSAMKKGWCTLRVDGRGYQAMSHTGEKLDSDELLVAMDKSHKRYQELYERYGKICFIGHPKAGGMALTLTASPTEFFYSNVFDGEARVQAEARFHRAGMDTNRGATIIDIIHLKTDKLILESLQKKRRLETLAMGQLQEAINVR